MINTYSSFYYGYRIGESNFKIDFNEGASDLVAEVDTGEYTLSGSRSIAKAIEAALNLEGALNYIVTVDRISRRITISADGPFSLNVVSGPNSLASALTICGFTQDKTGSSSYYSDIPSGKVFEPQFYLQSYMPTSDNKKAIDANVNESSSGEIEVYKFGDKSFMECEIVYQTSLNYEGVGLIKHDPTGEESLRDFLEYITSKAPIEFMEDLEDPNSYETFILEKTKSDSNGTGFKMYEMYAQGYLDHYETKLLTFRKLEG